jgi:hypothetical protein
MVTAVNDREPDEVAHQVLWRVSEAMLETAAKTGSLEQVTEAIR